MSKTQSPDTFWSVVSEIFRRGTWSIPLVGLLCLSLVLIFADLSEQNIPAMMVPGLVAFILTTSLIANIHGLLAGRAAVRLQAGEDETSDKYSRNIEGGFPGAPLLLSTLKKLWWSHGVVILALVVYMAALIIKHN